MPGCAELIAELVAQGGERGAFPLLPSVDYKAPMAWPAKGSDERARLVRHFAAFANARDGGYMLIGVDDKTRLPIGIEPDAAVTWDPSRVTESVATFLAPVPALDICHGRSSTGDLLIAIHVAPFEEQPVVCIRDHARKAHGAPEGRLILRAGAIYVRAPGASSREVNSESLMRDLLDRAYVKKADRLLEQIVALLEQHGLARAASTPAKLVDQIRADLEELGWP